MPLPVFHMLASEAPESGSSSEAPLSFFPIDPVFSYWRESLLLFMRVRQRLNFRARRNLRKISNFAPLLSTELER